MIRFTLTHAKTRSLDFFPDGSHLVGVGGTGLAVWVWNIQEKRLVEKISLKEMAIKAHPNFFLENVAVLPENRIVAQAGFRQLLVCKWPNTDDIQNLQWDDHYPTWMRPVFGNSAIFCHFTGSRKFQLLNYDEDGVEQFEHLEAKVGYSSIGFRGDVSRDRKHIITGMNAGIVVSQTSAPHEILANLYMGYVALSAEFNPTGDQFVVVFDKHAQVFQTLGGEPCCDPLKHTRKVQRATYTPDGRRLLTATTDGQLHIWDAQTYQLLTSYDFDVGHVKTFCVSSDGLTVALGGEGYEVIVMDLDA